MFPWKSVCIAAVAVVIVLVIKIIFLYHGMREIGRQFGDRLSGDTNNVIYVSGNDRHLKAFAGQINRELGILYDRRRKYQNGDRELKEAVTNISHDLRTPFTAIYGYLELLRAELEPEAVHACASGCVPRNVPCTETVTHYLAQIQNRADAMRELTEELFRYSVILAEQEKDAGEKMAEAVSLNRILADCLLSYYDIFRQNQIEPEVTIPDEEVVRTLDAGALKRVFCNILDNAVKYSKSGIPDQNPKICVALCPDGTITFQNSAQNLDRVSVERLFDRFYTVETGRNATGLGLSIAKLLTERMGGSIAAEYEGGGLTIRIGFE